MASTRNRKISSQNNVVAVKIQSMIELALWTYYSQHLFWPSLHRSRSFRTERSLTMLPSWIIIDA